MEIYKKYSFWEAKKIGKRMYNKFKCKLTADEKKSLKKYKRDGQKINAMCRAGETSFYIDNISSAIKKSIIDENIIVTRETSIKFLEANSKSIMDIKVGDILKENGFTSTYLFSPILSKVFKGRIHLIIKIPKNTFGAYINYILPFSLYKFENELLLDRGAIFRVENSYFKNNRLFLEVLCLGYE